MLSSSLNKTFLSFLLTLHNLSTINLAKHPEVQIECYPISIIFVPWSQIITFNPKIFVLNISINSKDQNGTCAVNHGQLDSKTFH